MYTRQIYSGLDWIGDVGGLLDGLRLLGYMLVMFFQFIIGNPLNAFLLSSVFKRGETSRSLSLRSRLKALSQREPFKYSSNLFDCFRKAKSRRLIKEGLYQAHKELEVDEFIKVQKKLRVTLKTIFTRPERLLLSNQRCFVLQSSSKEVSKAEQVQPSTGISHKHPYFDFLLQGTL